MYVSPMRRTQYMRKKRNLNPQVVFIDHHPIYSGRPIFNLAYLLAENNISVEYIGYIHNARPKDEWVLKRFRVREFSACAPEWMPTTVARFLRSFQYCFKCFFLYAIIKKPKIIITLHYTTLPLASIISFFAGSNLIYYCAEYTKYTDIDVKFWRFLLFLERFFVRFARYIIAPEPWRARKLQQDWRLNRSVDIIENAALKILSNRVPQRSQKHYTLRAIYAGRIAPNTCITELLYGLQMCKNVELVLIGHVLPTYKDEFVEILNETKQKGVNVEYKGTVPYFNLQEMLSNFDVGVTLYRGIRLNEKYCAPGKMYQYIAAGLACLLPEFPRPKQLIAKYGFGIAVNPKSPESIASAFTRLQDISLLVSLKKKARKAFLSELNYEFQSRNLVKYILKVCNPAQKNKHHTRKYK